MSLSTEILTQFAKITNDNKKTEKSSTIQGTARELNGTIYVQMDGSELLTPASATTDMKDGDRVTITVKDHSAIATGNITSPAARSGDVQAIGNAVSAQGSDISIMGAKIDIQDSNISAMNSNILALDSQIRAQDSKISIIDSTVETNQSEISTLKSTVKTQESDISTIKSNIQTQNSNISTIDSKVSTVESTVQTQGSTIANVSTVVNNQGSTISNLQTTVQNQGSNISTLNSSVEVVNSAFKIENGELTGIPKIITDTLVADEAFIGSIVANDIVTETLDAEYIKAGFTNIGTAEIEKLFADSGMITDLAIDHGHVTGELTGVTINGELINAGTLHADRIVLETSDGLFYELNSKALKDAGLAIPTDISEICNGLHGAIINDGTLTADKIYVTDLYAFGATIGGFDITSDSIHSHLKPSVNSASSGIYLGKDGQMAIGDNKNHVKYFYDEATHSWKLDIAADNFRIGNSSKTLQEEITDSIQVGGRNFVLKSDTEVSNEKHLVAIYDVSTPLVAGETYTSTICVTPANGVTSINTGLSNGYILSASHPISGSDRQIVSVTFVAKYASGRTPADAASNARLLYYRKPNDGTVSGPTTIHWVKVEKGNKATDWSPAPEDIGPSIDEKLDTMQVGGRNLIKTRTPCYISEKVAANITEADGGGINLVYGDASQDTYFEIRLWQNLIAGKEYTLSFDCSGVEDGKIPSYRISKSNVSSFALANGRVVQTFIPSEDITSGYLMLDDVGTRPASTNVLLSNFKLEAGNKATDYTPAPEDISLGFEEIQQSISSVQNDMGQQQDDLKQEIGDVLGRANDAYDKAAGYEERINHVEIAIQALDNCLQTLVTDGDNGTLMQQTETGWTFNIGALSQKWNDAADKAGTLEEQYNGLDGTVGDVRETISGMGSKLSCIELGDSNGKPFIELRTSEESTGSDRFKVRITNEDIKFMDGTSVPASISNQELHIDKADIENELRFGDFVWKKRNNGNMGLMWKG